MPRYSFNFWEEQKWGITFEADSLEHATQLMEEAQVAEGVEDLPDMERFYKKGDETWDYETLTEVEEN
jgi:hypothetical protein